MTKENTRKFLREVMKASRSSNSAVLVGLLAEKCRALEVTRLRESYFMEREMELREDLAELMAANEELTTKLVKARAQLKRLRQQHKDK